jgi:hypothetical protein
MVRVTTLLSILAFFTFQLNAQITITSEDMPVPGDTIRKSNTVVLDGINYQQGGPDQTWLFDELTVATQVVDTFVNVGETPSIYQLFFNNQWIYPDYKATVAQKLAEFTAIPTITLTDSYLFIKNSDEDIREVGYGVTLAGVALPIQFQQIDTTYRFPMEYGNVDSAHSFFEIDVPDVGYLMISKFRKNTVDGWGTLVTPYGEFQTLRVKTEIAEYDSLYSDSLGVGIPVIRNIIEYKWWANGHPEPMLLVSEEGPLITASYIDSLRAGLLVVQEVNPVKNDFSVFPNPANDFVTVSYNLTEDADVTVSVFSIYGSELKRFSASHEERGLYNQVLQLKENGFPGGIYLVRLTIDNVPFVKRILLD